MHWHAAYYGRSKRTGWLCRARKSQLKPRTRARESEPNKPSKPRKASLEKQAKRASELSVNKPREAESMRKCARCCAVRLRACIRCSSVVVRANAATFALHSCIRSFVHSFINCLLSCSLSINETPNRYSVTNCLPELPAEQLQVTHKRYCPCCR